MKKILFVIVLVFGFSAAMPAQNQNDYVVLDPSAPNFSQLQAHYSGQSNVLVNNNAKPAPYVIAEMLKGRQFIDLHIYVATQPGSINFQSVAITSENTNTFSQFFAAWKQSVIGRVIIHSDDVFTATQGLNLKNQLEQIAGMAFSMQ